MDLLDGNIQTEAGAETSTAANVRAQGFFVGSSNESNATAKIPANAMRCWMHITQGFMSSTYCENNEAHTPAAPRTAMASGMVLWCNRIVIFFKSKGEV